MIGLTGKAAQSSTMEVVTALLNCGSHRPGSPALFAAAFPQELVLALEWLDSEGRSSFVAVGLLIDSVCSFPNTLNSALPSFSMSLTQRLISAGVAAISAMSRISPARKDNSQP
jgi:hypothetical protein